MVTQRFTTTRAVLVVSMAVCAAAVLLSLGSSVRLHAQSPVAKIPDLVGDWVSESSEGCSYDNVWDANGIPRCGATPGGAVMRITVQEGRAFAGTFLPVPRSKVTGAVGPDGTLVLQAWLGNNRMFFSGTVATTKHGLRVSGLANEFEDWKAMVPSMGSFSMTLRKVQ